MELLRRAMVDLDMRRDLFSHLVEAGKIEYDPTVPTLVAISAWVGGENCSA